MTRGSAPLLTGLILVIPCGILDEDVGVNETTARHHFIMQLSFFVVYVSERNVKDGNGLREQVVLY